MNSMIDENIIVKDHAGNLADADYLHVILLNQDDEVIDSATPEPVSTGLYKYTNPLDISGKLRILIQKAFMQVNINKPVMQYIPELITTFNAKLVSEDETFKKGTYGETVCFQLFKQRNIPVQLDDAETITLHLKNKEFSMIIQDSARGIVSYTFKEGDLDFAGEEYLEIELVNPGGCFVSENRVSIVVLSRIN